MTSPAAIVPIAIKSSPKGIVSSASKWIGPKPQLGSIAGNEQQILRLARELDARKELYGDEAALIMGELCRESDTLTRANEIFRIAEGTRGGREGREGTRGGSAREVT